jgi:hypothetical protein
MNTKPGDYILFCVDAYFVRGHMIHGAFVAKIPMRVSRINLRGEAIVELHNGQEFWPKSWIKVLDKKGTLAKV